MMKKDLKAIQYYLKEKGLYLGPIDGIWGPETNRAILNALDIGPPTGDVTLNTAFEVASHEAVIRQAYRDSANVWTWSVGLTSATGHNVERYRDNPQTMQHCMDIYAWALKSYAQQVFKVFEDYPLTEEAAAGFISFHWNTGAIRRASFVDLYKKGLMQSAETSFMRWNKPGLTQRRKREADLIWRGKWNNEAMITEYTKLTSRHTPNWNSAIRISIREELIKAFASPQRVEFDLVPKPLHVPETPTLTPPQEISND